MRPRQIVLRLTALVIAAAFLCTPGRAAFQQLTTFTGSLPVTVGNPQMRVNFTVFQAQNPGVDNWSAIPGVGASIVPVAGTPDYTSSYVFFYELYVNNGASSTLNDFVLPGSYKSMGYLGSTIFFGGTIGVDAYPILPSYTLNGGAPLLAETPLGTGETVNFLPAPGVAATIPPPARPTMQIPTSGSLASYPAQPTATFSFSADNVDPTQYTPVLYVTSNSLPVWYKTGTVDFGGVQSLNTGNGIPGAAVPEPGTMLLSVMGLSAFGGLGALRRRRGEPKDI